jgi:hypothetical protein
VIDDILGGIFGEVVLGRLSGSRRAQLLFRLFFGLLGGGLAVAGAVHFSLRTDLTTNTAMRFSMIALFVFLGCFSIFNIALARTWRWPGRLFVLSLVALFATRLLFGR